MSATRPLAPALVAAGVEASEPLLARGALQWLEHRFAEGRSVVMRRAATGGPAVALTPEDVDVGSLAWEYGGGSHLICGEAAIYADRDDQRLYRVEPGGARCPLTPVPATPCGKRYADGALVRGGRTFAGGMARCGIADIGRWRTDAHDYESRYVDLLVGPPARRALWAERSPARNVTSDAGPLLLIHGTADRVVPPGHARAMAAAYLRANLPHELLLLEGEPHGLRRSSSVERALEAELRHHGRLLAAIG